SGGNPRSIRLKDPLDAEIPVRSVVFVDPDGGALAFHISRGRIHPGLTVVEDVATEEIQGEVRVDAVLAAKVELGVVPTIEAVGQVGSLARRIIAPDGTRAATEALVAIAQTGGESMRKLVATGVGIAPRVRGVDRDAPQRLMLERKRLAVSDLQVAEAHRARDIERRLEVIARVLRIPAQAELLRRA